MSQFLLFGIQTAMVSFRSRYFYLGLIDVIEFFSALVIYSNSRIEDKIRCKNNY